jgi:shikimate dehydrogenase
MNQANTVSVFRVLGNPIAHSKSPEIHRSFASATGKHIEYIAQQVDDINFEAVVADFFAHGGKGLNITVPFKQRAHDMAIHVRPAARRAGAANTLWQEQGQLVADNTDGIGLLRDIRQNLNGILQGSRILVLGAGGAVRGILQPLLEQQPQQLVLANRTHQKAQKLAQDFSELGPVSACEVNRLKAPFDWIINATAASLTGDLLDLPSGLINYKARCYDMMYGDKAMNFRRWALTQGASTVNDGLGMLVEQAAAAFYLWHNIYPDTAKVLMDLQLQFGCSSKHLN